MLIEQIRPHRHSAERHHTERYVGQLIGRDEPAGETGVVRCGCSDRDPCKGADGSAFGNRHQPAIVLGGQKVTAS